MLSSLWVLNGCVKYLNDGRTLRWSYPGTPKGIKLKNQGVAVEDVETNQ